MTAPVPRTLAALALAGAAVAAGCRSDVESPAGGVYEARNVEASCGQCLFDLEGEGCDLAVRIDGQAYYVDGASIDDYGDAHAEDGFCNAIRRAVVSGRLENDRFVVTSFELAD